VAARPGRVVRPRSPPAHASSHRHTIGSGLRTTSTISGSHWRRRLHDPHGNSGTSRIPLIEEASQATCSAPACSRATQLRGSRPPVDQVELPLIPPPLSWPSAPGRRVDIDLTTERRQGSEGQDSTCATSCRRCPRCGGDADGLDPASFPPPLRRLAEQNPLGTIYPSVHRLHLTSGRDVDLHPGSRVFLNRRRPPTQGLHRQGRQPHRAKPLSIFATLGGRRTTSSPGRLDQAKSPAGQYLIGAACRSRTSTATARAAATPLHDAGPSPTSHQESVVPAVEGGVTKY